MSYLVEPVFQVDFSLEENDHVAYHLAGLGWCSKLVSAVEYVGLEAARITLPYFINNAVNVVPKFNLVENEPYVTQVKEVLLDATLAFRQSLGDVSQGLPSAQFVDAPQLLNVYVDITTASFYCDPSTQFKIEVVESGVVTQVTFPADYAFETVHKLFDGYDQLPLVCSVYELFSEENLNHNPPKPLVWSLGEGLLTVTLQKL